MHHLFPRRRSTSLFCSAGMGWAFQRAKSKDCLAKGSGPPRDLCTPALSSSPRQTRHGQSEYNPAAFPLIQSEILQIAREMKRESADGEGRGVEGGGWHGAHSAAQCGRGGGWQRPGLTGVGLWGSLGSGIGIPHGEEKNVVPTARLEEPGRAFSCPGRVLERSWKEPTRVLEGCWKAAAGPGLRGKPVPRGEKKTG